MTDKTRRGEQPDDRSARASAPTGTPLKVASLVALGRAHYENGEIDKACSALLEALAHDADNAEALFLTGAIAHQSGLHEIAVRNLGRAVANRPTLVQAHAFLALALLSLGRHDDALASFRSARDLEPDTPDHHSNLGSLCRNLDRIDDAMAHFRRAIALKPDFALAYYNLACAMPEAADAGDGERHLRRALALNPDHLSTLYNLASARQRAGDLAEAAELYGHVLARKPDHQNAANNLALVLHALGRSAEGRAMFAQGLAGAQPSAVFNAAMLDLSMGRFEEGWKGYEARFDDTLPDNTNHPRRFAQPQWDGRGGIAGRRLLIWREQGIGDEIMFSSCLPDLEATGARVTFECTPKLLPLFRRSFPFAEVVCEDRARDPWRTDLDIHLPVGGLPRYLRRTLADFPVRGGFLRPDPDRVAHWRRRLEALGPGPYVGLCWRGKGFSLQRQDQFTRIEDWEPVLRLPGVTFVNMQYDEAGAEIALARTGFGAAIHTFADIDMWNDMDEVAALLKALDRLLTVATSVMSLAGGVGLDTRMLLRFAPETWTLLGTADRTPFYPSVRPHLRRAGQSWEPLIRGIAADLLEMTRPSGG